MENLGITIKFFTTVFPVIPRICATMAEERVRKANIFSSSSLFPWLLNLFCLVLKHWSTLRYRDSCVTTAAKALFSGKYHHSHETHFLFLFPKMMSHNDSVKNMNFLKCIEHLSQKITFLTVGMWLLEESNLCRTECPIRSCLVNLFLPFYKKEMNLRGSRTLIKVIKQLKEKSSKSSRCGSVISHWVVAWNAWITHVLKVWNYPSWSATSGATFVSVSGKPFRVLCIIH